MHKKVSVVLTAWYATILHQHPVKVYAGAFWDLRVAIRYDARLVSLTQRAVAVVVHAMVVYGAVPNNVACITVWCNQGC